MRAATAFDFVSWAENLQNFALIFALGVLLFPLLRFHRQTTTALRQPDTRAGRTRATQHRSRIARSLNLHHRLVDYQLGNLKKLGANNETSVSFSSPTPTSVW